MQHRQQCSLAETISTQVDDGEHKGGERECRQAEGSRVGEFALLGRLVETRLQFTTECLQAHRLAGVHMGKWIAAVVIRLALLLQTSRVVGSGGSSAIDGVAESAVDSVVFLSSSHDVELV